jgi:CRISPR-associated endonuclease/helicase Cas3
MCEKLIAHVVRKDDGSWDVPQKLSDHLENTARLAEKFAAKFGSGGWGRAAGLAHDAGKGREKWQQYLQKKSGYFDDEAHLEGKPGKMPHAIHGAMMAEKLYGKGLGRILAYCIAGHHAGLPDWSPANGAGQASLQYQQSQCQGIDEIDESVIQAIKNSKPGRPPWIFSKGLDAALWIRMLYSTLVDADFLDTEAYMDGDRAALRGNYCSMTELLERFNQYIGKLDEVSEKTRVNEIRRNIRTKCVEAASNEQGIFSLSVPTGGGKTLSSLAFALEHAVKHNLDRIIYVIPYTSIIEQNADVFRKAIGADQVVEHHSNLVESDSTPKSRLASENWDAPLIVTTSVQFFESLFAAKSSRCRKLHNVTRSVVILDEAQLVPADFLIPILATMQLLVDHYQVSFVISTATQPAFNERQMDDRPFPGLKDVKEMMGDAKEVESLYHSLERFRVEFPIDIHSKSTWEDIAAELRQHEQVLCVVSDRKSCRELHSLMPRGTYHLSALMCGQHRSEVIADIKDKLKNGEPVRVISTQLVEAGVDLDFPVVYRAFAGLDSVAQAGGRCNREGKLPNKGRVVVFIPPRQSPMGILRKAAETTASLLVITTENPLQPDMFTRYFSELYWRVNSLDSKDIVSLLDPEANDRTECSINFRTAAEKFKLIDEATRGILVPYGEGRVLTELLKVNGPDRWLLRKLQRYMVNIYNHEYNQLLKREAIFEVSPGVFALATDADYSLDTGLMVEPFFDPDKFVL